MSELRASRRCWSIEHWPEPLRILHHALLGGLLIVIASTFEAAGDAWRKAAQHGGTAARAWVRAAVGHHDALSALERAATGAGCALVGFGILQVGYAVLVSGRDRPVEPFAEPFVAWQWAVFALGAPALSDGVGSVMYPGTGVLMGAITAAYVLVLLIYRQQVARAALAVPQWFTAVAGAGFWLFLDVMWKIDHAPRVHEAPAMVAVPLGLGLAGLMGVSWGLGWIARRTAWLRPTPTGGQ
ncbi:hypothetical protein L0Z42_29195 [Burkholderia multivorans]|uniref:hypothetical protein n=1 Tax=Burkholderia multivorans TaxID=87883 RepID=UPI000CFEB7C7|nr:hypothetical protein [Burkholderia multivorans]MBR8022462.1 hypothetical protein [Burkholderia multivorans]MBU9146960.1 hypothetical protein [Burkholderia multivorans]MBU9247073.1 hypothetical protein [Burkholderia multivorans]MBU9540808.1 hypothetical protein [Burkholderia multivorans]MCO1374571.1 hypothetical protein [Burkholderia multivorans]